VYVTKIIPHLNDDSEIFPSITTNPPMVIKFQLTLSMPPREITRCYQRFLARIGW